MTDWIDRAHGLDALDADARGKLAGVRATTLPADKVLFRPGDEVRGFVLVLSGRVEVYLTGQSGREILLYGVEPGETCVQTTLGLLGEEDYSAEAVTGSEVEIAVVPKPVFLDLLASSPAFRTFVFHAFATRLQAIMHVLEQVAFIRVEARLAAALLARAGADGVVHITHQDLATVIGSSREVVSRRLETMSGQGLVTLERGRIRISDPDALRRIAD